MKQVSVTELKNKLSQYLRLVKRGETIEVLERSVPIARLHAVHGGAGDVDAHLRRLVRDGIVARAKRSGDKRFLRKPPVPCRADVVQALVEERGDR
jgi:antitoxin (DNA-binding transcriptional repressor) of toxin-antitoxin stability system